jgi:hypothetical protein
VSAAFCSRCGKPLPAGAGACPACGAPVPAAPAPTAPRIAPAAPARTCLQCHTPMRLIGPVNFRSAVWTTVPDPILGASQQAVDSFFAFHLHYCPTCGRFDLYYPGT